MADIAHTLLKVSPYDPESMGCRGLQHYMTYILPATEWSNDAMRPALVTILRRLDKVFQKISKKPSIRVSRMLLIKFFLNLQTNLVSIVKYPETSYNADVIFRLAQHRLGCRSRSIKRYL